MIGLIVVILLVLAFSFVAYQASKTWKASHVVLLFFVFLMSLIFTALSAMSLKTRESWKKKHDGLITQIESKQAELDRIEYGSLTDTEVASIPAMQTKLRQVTLDRGRVWRGVIPAGAGEDGIVLNMAQWGGEGCFAAGDEDDPQPVPDPEADAPVEGEAPVGSGKPHGLEDGTVVYAFLEAPAADNQKPALFGESELPNNDQRGLCRVPVFYLGNFRVAGVDGPNVQLQPILPSDEQQINAINAGQTTWVLYEIMPVDHHEVLAGLPADQLAALFPESPDQSQIVQEFAADLQPAQPGADPQRTRQRVKFLRDYEVDVDVDAAEEGLENFDPSGRALAAELRQGEPTKFKEGDTPKFPFDSVTAEKLRADGIVEFLDEPPIFVRRLRDYAALFVLTSTEEQSVVEEMALLKADNDAIAGSAQQARAQIAFREQEIAKLNVDLKQLQTELETLAVFRKKLQQRFDEQRGTMSSLYNWNNQLADELRGFIFAGE